MSTYEDHMTLRARPLTDADYAARSGSWTMSRAGMSPTTYSFHVGDFLCQKWVGNTRDSWIEPNSTFAASGWYPVTPPDGNGYCVYSGAASTRTCTVTDLDNGYFECSSGCMVDYATFWASHTLNP